MRTLHRRSVRERLDDARWHIADFVADHGSEWVLVLVLVLTTLAIAGFSLWRAGVEPSEVPRASWIPFLTWNALYACVFWALVSLAAVAALASLRGLGFLLTLAIASLACWGIYEAMDPGYDFMGTGILCVVVACAIFAIAIVIAEGR